MKKRNLKRKGTAVIAATLAAGMLIPSMAFAAGPVVKVGTDSSVQMSSDPEVVYINKYAGTTRSENFNDNWKFYLGDAEGAQNANFDDSKWEQVKLPHDYSIEQEYTQTGEAESGYLLGGTGWYRKNFTLDENAAGKRVRIDFGGVYMDSTVWVNGHQVGSHPYGYTPFSFDITEYVNFGEDNVITVKVDHQTPSSRWYSGSGIYRSVDLTITEPIHVDLYGTKIETPNLETEAGGTVNTKIRTTVVNASNEEKSITLTHTVFPEGGDGSGSIGTVTTDAVQVAAGKNSEIEATVGVNDPVLWSTDNPALYTVRTEVKVGDQVVDTYDTRYGFRYFAFDADTGFSLNGKKMKLEGVCMHHDQGALGAEAWESAIDRQVKILKEMGTNSIRVTHNPAADELIEACEEQGILVIDEAFDGWAWAKNGNGNDYARFFKQTIGQDNEILGAEDGMTWAQFDLSAMVKRGWNSPSIIMWSLGNEVQEGATGQLTQEYRDVQSDLIRWTQELDTTKLVTRGDNRIKSIGSGTVVDMLQDLTDADGTAGMNYSGGGNYDFQRQQHPDWIIYGAETASAVNSRGVYDRLGNGSSSQTGDKLLTSYDNSHVGWGATASSAWYDVITRDFVAGEYVWTGFDYIGEPTPWNGTSGGAAGAWPSPKNSYFGIVDTAGLPKDSYYFYQSQWNEDVNTLHLLPAWNEDVVKKDSDGNVPVVVYTDAAKVELFFTPAGSDQATSLGEKQFTPKTTAAGFTYQIYEGEGKDSAAHKNLYLTWKVPYKAGTITAKAWDAEGNLIDLGTVEGRTSVTTTGKAAKLEAEADRTKISADGSDLSYITVSVKDKNGNIVPDAENNVKFTVEGEGKLIGVDNGRQDDHQSYQDNNRNAFSGQLVAIVQSTKIAGDVTVTANADGLEASTVTITTTPVEDGSDETNLNYYMMPKNYYVKTGNTPQLPATVKAVYSDKSEKDMPIVWDPIPEGQIGQTGTFSIAGVTEVGDVLSVTINMIEDVAALLNYSTTVPIGQNPVLPESRPAVLPTGEVISASFPVKWGQPDGSYDTEGIVRVEGTANVLGKELTVTANVRVQEQTIALGDNVAGSAYLSQDILADFQGDTLNAINDGSRDISDNTSGGANPTIWSNWKNTNNNSDNDAEITFRYDTQQRIGQITVYFAKDTSGLRFPDSGTTEIYISEGGTDWEKVEVIETIADAEAPERVKAYTYDFDPRQATFVKLYVKNPTETDLERPAVAISEVEINEWTGSYNTNSDAAFTSMTVNGLSVSESDLTNGSFNTEAILVDSLEYEVSGNAAVTELPVYDGKKALIIESEDHSQRNTFTINLGAEHAADDPADDSRDYTGTVTATAGSEYTGSSATDGPASWAVDNKTNTWWHTAYSGVDASQRWITLELQEAQLIDGYRYYARSGAANGRVQEYLIEVSDTGNDGEWTTVASGTWDNSEGWKLAEFMEPVTAKYVRLTGVHTYGAGDQADLFMTAAEIRVKVAPTLIDISAADVNIPTKTVSVVDEEHPVTLTKDDITAVLGDTTLRYGVDYIVTYENNTSAGNATAVITGLNQYGYTGTKEVSFTITLREPVLTGIQITTPCKVDYTEGDAFDPSALVLTALYDNGTSQSVSYADHSAEITFALADGTPLTAGTALTTAQNGAAVTVTYAGLTTQFTIRVNGTVAPDPEQPVINTIVSAQPVKTSYTAGETFDPTGLALTLTYADGTTRTVVYSAATASGFTFDPPLGTPLTASDTSIRVTYGGASAAINISTAANTGGTNPGTSAPVTPTDPPANTGQSVNQAVKTGDKANVALITVSAILAGATVLITFLWRKRPTR